MGRTARTALVQRVLELLGVPHTGTGPFACQVTLDKGLMKEVLRAAGIPSPGLATVQAAAICDVSCADVLVDPERRQWVVDVNVSPGMTDTSLLPMAAQRAGMPLADLCERNLVLALERHVGATPGAS